ncbi:hypothetical protein J2W17_001196 [Pseudomonas lini]|uniref:hypothetical protein n=1 Tax=Pseudomonas lini TaxID=163011 RepID=UPI00278A10D0|nr:hypothetical protein [Pseudomonas lini]MDQ0122251.1 hypothetical protein [Pseudomonas lini]
MSTEQGRSFIARISVDHVAMVTVDELLNNPTAQVEQDGFSFSSTATAGPEGRFLTTWHSYSQISGAMSTLRSTWDGRTRQRIKEMFVYFRCYEDYYNIQIRSEYYFGCFFSKNSSGILGAFPPAGGATTSFNMLDSSHNIITLDDLETDQATVFLKARNAGLINRQLTRDKSHYTYADQPGDTVRFSLDIIERDAPYPTSSEPLTRYLEPTRSFANTATADSVVSISAGFANNKAYTEWTKND